MKVLGVDPGSAQSGLCLIENGRVLYASNEDNARVFDVIGGFSGATVVIEDVYPYSVRLSVQVIQTCKFIGELSFRLQEAGYKVHFTPRNTIKKWVFDAFPEICLPRIRYRIEYLHKLKTGKGLKGMIKKDGEFMKPSFVYVDDRIIIASMKELLKIPTPKPGKPNIYGLKSHSWQALAVAAHYSTL